MEVPCRFNASLPPPPCPMYLRTLLRENKVALLPSLVSVQHTEELLRTLSPHVSPWQSWQQPLGTLHLTRSRALCLCCALDLASISCPLYSCLPCSVSSLHLLGEVPPPSWKPSSPLAAAQGPRPSSLHALAASHSLACKSKVNF